MTMPPSSDGGPKRMSRTVKLVLMGVGAAALLYSCAPAVGGLGGIPYFWFLPNPFFRGAAVNPATQPTTTTKPAPTTTPRQAQTPSQRGGFGSSAGHHGTTSSS